MEMVVEGKRGVGRPRMTWVKAVESDMRVKGLMKEDAEDRTKWRAMLLLLLFHQPYSNHFWPF